MLPKVFVIGFNKCGTTSLHRMFLRAGHRSSHHRHLLADGSSVKLASRMHDNARAGHPLLTGIEDAGAYSDMDICGQGRQLSGIALFRTLDRQYPDSRFILNTRDPQNWLTSRGRHLGGGYLRRAMRLAGVADAGQMRAIWLREWHAHHAAVRTHFAGRPDQMLVFDIEGDDPLRLCRFLPGFGLRPGHWRHHNRTPDSLTAPPPLALAS
ncbi:MAG: sulfotransferase [Paracoccus sp. (in: a-proteobacteria)]|nr:sulfotransferase [Paracoccus sp. (in: a-proteobacteria)]